jgi:hypothetical protein
MLCVTGHVCGGRLVRRYKFFSPHRPEFALGWAYRLLGREPSPHPDVAKAASQGNAGLTASQFLEPSAPAASCPRKTATERNADVPIAEFQKRE